MPRHDWYAMGQFNVQCDQCGLVYKSAQISQRWDGAFVCPFCWEPRQPQDFVRAVPDDQSTPFARIWSPVFEGSGPNDDSMGEVTVGDGPALGGP
jgi:hypothetical protein